MGTSVQPGKAPTQQLYVQLALLHIGAVNAGYFQFTPVAGFYLFGDVDHAVVVKVEASDCIMRFRVLGLFLNGDGAFVFIELDHAEAFRVFYLIAKYGGALATLGDFSQLGGKTLAIEDIVAQNQAYSVATDEVFGDDEGLGKSIRAWLDFVAEVNAELFAGSKRTFKAGLIFRRGDDEDILDARQHEYGERVVDHGFVVHRQELFGGAECYGVQAGA